MDLHKEVHTLRLKSMSKTSRAHTKASHTCKQGLRANKLVIAGTFRRSSVGGADATTQTYEQKIMDIYGSVMFLSGKLKELTDLVGGPEVLRSKQYNRAQCFQASLNELCCEGEDAYMYIFCVCVRAFAPFYGHYWSGRLQKHEMLCLTSRGARAQLYVLRRVCSIASVE